MEYADLKKANYITIFTEHYYVYLYQTIHFAVYK